MEKKGEKVRKAWKSKRKQAYSSLGLDWTSATGAEDLAFFPMTENLLESEASKSGEE